MNKRTSFYQSLYDTRKITTGYPNLEHLHSMYKQKENQEKLSKVESNEHKLLIDCLFKLVDFNELSKNTVDIGCGPTPTLIKELLAQGLNAKGIEPVDEMRQLAQEYVHDESRIIKGYAEKIPLPSNSQSFVSLEGVLEHVDSPLNALNEINRILEPGGVVYISTTNKYMFHNNEFIKPFFQWYPSILKESYIFMHLHYRPELAEYSSRPAVHWFCYSDLCQIGRTSGFCSFYSPIDLMSEKDDISHQKSGSLKKYLPSVKYSPFLRSMVLTFTSAGSEIFMIKR